MMVMSHQKTPRLKPLLNKVPPGFMVDTPWLRDQNIDPKSIHDYVRSGWLERVIRGVYRRPLPENVQASSDTEWQIPLLSLQWIMDWDVHLGGESALDLAGYSHYLSLGQRPRIHLYGDTPSWLKRLPTKTKFVIHRRSLFGNDHSGINETNRDKSGNRSDDTNQKAVNVWRWPIKASSPERAILEALDELPKHASFDNLDKVFEGLTTLRPKMLDTLLASCESVKVRRLFFVYADRHNHAWRQYIDTSKVDFGSGPRALAEGGKLHPTYKIYVPEGLRPAESMRAFDD